MGAFSISPKLYRVLFFSMVALVASCKPVNDRKEIKTVRKMGKLAPAAELGLPLLERVSGKSQEDAGSGATDIPFAWDAPDDWQAVPASAMRMANFTFGESAEGQCYFTMLRGGGGLLLNLNRWRSQMGLDPIEGEELAKLPDKRFLFGNGKFIELDGAFKPMGASEALSDYKMFGVIMPEMEMGEMKVAFFVKMTGPKQLVESQRENFDAFCASLRIKKARQ
ncbi:MAG: hypothetical protein GY899_17070 [Verrucomicrobiaceae bacterium]|nr:hypothetical protein [Verrucomicrobiaceae bacterium]